MKVLSISNDEKLYLFKRKCGACFSTLEIVYDDLYSTFYNGLVTVFECGQCKTVNIVDNHVIMCLCIGFDATYDDYDKYVETLPSYEKSCNKFVFSQSTKKVNPEFQKWWNENITDPEKALKFFYYLASLKTDAELK